MGADALLDFAAGRRQRIEPCPAGHQACLASWRTNRDQPRRAESALPSISGVQRYVSDRSGPGTAEHFRKDHVGVLGKQTRSGSAAQPIGAASWQPVVSTVLVLMFMVCSGGYLRAQAANEYEVKVAFLYKFASFVEWPPEAANEPLCIAVVGQDPFGPALD